ncbi:hypothetical protein fHeYen902_089c [Yersinia phage fHe-Yen9-02]|nr:hypothetical protein fHeYen902_089c [Yersinia phage fHe-Yen9-02]
MRISISLSAIQMSAQALTKIVGFRVLDHRLLREDNGIALYAFVAYSQGDTGDYELKVAKLIRKGLATNSYKLKNIATIAENFQSVYEASSAMEKLNPTGEFTSLSAPPPLSSFQFWLSDLGIKFSPELDMILNEWLNTQKIARVQYACVDPRQNIIEVSLIDPSRDNEIWLQEQVHKSLKQIFASYGLGLTVPIETQENFRSDDLDRSDPSENPNIVRKSNMKITLSLCSDVISESAKTPSYKFAKVSGVRTLIIPDTKKPELTAILGLLKKAKVAAISGMTSRVKADTTLAKSKQVPAGPRRVALRATYVTEKTKSAADIKQAKALLKEANSHAKKHGLSGLNMPMSSTDIATGPGVVKALKAVRAIKLTEFGATGKRGTFKPKFVKQSAFDSVGVKVQTPASKAAREKAETARSKVLAKGKIARPTHKARIAAKKEMKQDRTKAKAAAVKKPQGSDTAEKIDKALPEILNSVGFKFNVGRDAGLIRNLKGGKIAKSNEGLAKMREKLAKKFTVVDTAKGFEVPGLLEIKTGPTGVVIVRPDRYDKSKDPAIRVRK